MAAPTPGNQTESYPQGVQEVFDFAGMIDRTSPAEHQRELDQLVLDEVGKFESGEARLVALEGLYQQAYDQEPFARAINTERDRKYGDKLLDVSFEQIPMLTERLLDGKNPAIVVRASEWTGHDGKTSELIANSLSGLGQFDIVGEEKFPKPSMPTGSSGLHLDNFRGSNPPGFRYTFSAAEIEEGSVLFFGGLARGKALNTSRKVEGVSHPYDEAALDLENLPAVQRLYKLAQKGQAPAYTEISSQGTKLFATVLNKGDVVIWPQGGPGSKTPSWHAFRKIGQAERRSTSTHFVKQA